MSITLEKAVAFCRLIEPTLKANGYHCGLTGSVLFSGESSKDADIIVYPHDVSKQLSPDEIIAILTVHGIAPKFDDPPSTCDKEVIVTMADGIRYDLFFLK